MRFVLKASIGKCGTDIRQKQQMIIMERIRERYQKQAMNALASISFVIWFVEKSRFISLPIQNRSLATTYKKSNAFASVFQ